jgi:enamine deaminase RidA (YjgF/YER057c/UK114 family)
MWFGFTPGLGAVSDGAFHTAMKREPCMTPTDPEARLTALGLALPEPAKPVAAYIPARRSGNLLFIAGQIPLRSGKLIAEGPVPSKVSPEIARECARQCVLNGLAAVKAALGSLAAVKQVVRVGVFVCSDAGFTAQPQVANGASELLVEVFGEAGRHARAAVGSIALPLGAPVEVEFLFEV